MENEVFKRILHRLIEKFVISVEEFIESKQVQRSKILREILKRSSDICRGIRSAANEIYTAVLTADIPISSGDHHVKIMHLVQNHLQRDLLECALNAWDDHEIFHLTSDDLHNFLFMHCTSDTTSFSPVCFDMRSITPFSTGAFELNLLNSLRLERSHSSEIFGGFNCCMLSTEFDNSRIKFEEELSELRNILENGFPETDFSAFEVTSKLNSGGVGSISKLGKECKSQFNSSNDFIQSTTISPKDSCLGIFDDVLNSETDPPFLSWEGRMMHSLPCHIYTLEMTRNDAVLNISEEDSAPLQSLLNLSEIISEYDMVHHILDMLIGIPSSTFIYNDDTKKFHLKPRAHVLNLSHGSTSELISEFIEYGTKFYSLQKFSESFQTEDWLSKEDYSEWLKQSKNNHKALCSCCKTEINIASIGESALKCHMDRLIQKSLHIAVNQILSVYKEYIISVRMNSPSMQLLRTDVLEEAQLLNTLGSICGLCSREKEFDIAPKGLGLLSKLHHSAWAHKRKENAILIAVLLKYTYAPYFNFLNKWMTEGICYDPYGEFQIMEDSKYLSRRDELYWKFAYTENVDDSMRAVPAEISKYSQGILQCGKSIRLLKLCCPELFSLKYIFCNPPPELSMVFSFHGAIKKANASVAYIQQKEQVEKEYEANCLEISEDQFLINCQVFVDKRTMFNRVERRSNILHISHLMNENVKCHHNKISNLNNCKNKSSKDTDSSRNSVRKYHSLCDLAFKEDESQGFSGKLLSCIGLLFSSCGYINNTESNILDLKIFTNGNCSLCSENFSKQLKLKSFAHVIPSKIFGPENQFHCMDVDFTFDCGPKSGYGKYMPHNSTRISSEFFNKKRLSPIYLSYQDETNYCISNNDIFHTKLAKSAHCFAKEENADAVEKDILVGSFADRLLDLLLSDYRDNKNDIYSCIQMTSLQSLMLYNFSAILKMRIYLVEKMIMKFVINDLRLDSLLMNLRNVYFFQDEGFSQTLCEQLFSLVLGCKSPLEFANWTVLNEIISNAIGDSCCSNESTLPSLSVKAASVPEDSLWEWNDFLRLFCIEFKVEWPLNIIIHRACIAQYGNIFSKLLEMEFLCWLLGRIWRSCLTDERALLLQDSPQYKEVMLKRFDMDQFVRIIRNSIHLHFRGPLWEYLIKSISSDGLSIDALESIHMQYLEKALSRCFLTEENSMLHELISVIFQHIYNFCKAALECNWKLNAHTNVYETSAFTEMTTAFQIYKKYQTVFYKRILKETLTKKYGRYWDKEYLEFLEAIVETSRSGT